MVGLSRFSVGQMCSTDDIEYNLNTVATLASQASSADASLLVLPENVACFAQGAQQKTAQRFDELRGRFAALASKYQLWLVAGTLPCLYRPCGTLVPDGRVRSASLVFDPGGDCVARYDKIHLFDAQVADGTRSYRESDTFEAGNKPVVVNTEFGKLGLMICYDLRFAELAVTLRGMGADVLGIPAAFTYVTGRAHWHLLLRSRALDSQCMVLGSAQTGVHGDRRTFGHSCAVDAWGETVYQCSEELEHLGLVDFDKIAQNRVRQALNIHAHRKLTGDSLVF